MAEYPLENSVGLDNPPFISDAILNFWYKISHFASLVEIFSVLTFIFISHLFQKWVAKRRDNYLDDQENSSFYEQLVDLLISFTAPFMCFALISTAMSISTLFTPDHEIYRISIQLTFVWMAYNFLLHTISDFFVRSVILCTLIPLMIFTSLGLTAPVIEYLDSLSFTLGETRLSIFLILKGLFIATCLTWGASFVSHYTICFIEDQKKISVEVRDLMENLFHVILYTTITFITLDLLGIDLKSLAIVGGAIGIGVGLGLQKIAANFISGIIILFEQNVKVGHLVEIPGSTSPGWIRHLGTRAAIIDTGDGKQILIPNEDLLTKSLIDWTAKDRKMRIELSIKVSFESDLDLAKKIMLEAIRNHPNCSKNSSPACFLQKFTDVGAQFLLQYWVDDFTKGSMEMQNDVLFTIWKSFSEKNIKFPTSLQQINPV